MEQVRLDILKEEYAHACNRRQYLDDQANKYVSYILAFLGAIGAFLGLLVKDGKAADTFAIVLLVVAGALILGLLVIMMLHHTIQCYRAGGYIKYLEEAINKYASFDILKWETVVTTKHIHRDISAILVYSIVGVFFVVFLATAGFLSVQYILHTMPVAFGVIIIIGILEVATACVYLAKLGAAHKTIYELVEIKDDISESNIL